MTKKEKTLIFLLVLVVVWVVVCYLFRLTGIEIDFKDVVNLLVASGTIGMALIVLYIEIIGPWRQKPNIKIEFKDELLFHLDVISNSYSHYHIRLKVTNKGKSIARRVRGKLIDVKDKKDNILERFDPVFLHWSSIEILQKMAPYINEKKELKFKEYYEQPNYLDPLDLSPGEHDYLDVVYTGEEFFKKEEGKKREGLVKISTSTVRRGTAKEFWMNETKVTYFLTIVISGENIEPVTEKYEILWNGEKYDEITMCEVGRKKGTRIMAKPKKRANK